MDLAREGAAAGILVVVALMLIYQPVFEGSMPATVTLLPILLAGSGSLKLSAEAIGLP